MIFIDEIDSFLRERSSNDHQAHADMKCEFMTLWDGIGTPARPEGFGCVSAAASRTLPAGRGREASRLMAATFTRYCTLKP